MENILHDDSRARMIFIHQAILSRMGHAIEFGLIIEVEGCE